MFIQKNFSLKNILQFTGHHFIWLIPYVTVVVLIEHYLEWEWTRLPWQPIAVIGTAVAFYLGFKNNQSYDRLWEARKVWGAIVNSSRGWGSYVGGFVTNQFTSVTQTEEELKNVKQRLIYRHIAWLYALRDQLLQPTPWEHISQRGTVGQFANARREKFGLGLVQDQLDIEVVKKMLPENEQLRLLASKNVATQIVNQQSEDLKELRAADLIDDFRHMELQKVLYDFYVHQGKLERIKKFPLPRQYGSMSFALVAIFIAVLPFGLVPLFETMGKIGFWTSIPLTVVTAWVYLVMELVGDYSENPFEGTGNDIPMLSLCRTIEIDLREMLGEEDLPAPIKAKKGVLM